MIRVKIVIRVKAPVGVNAVMRLRGVGEPQQGDANRLGEVVSWHVNSGWAPAWLALASDTRVLASVRIRVRTSYRRTNVTLRSEIELWEGEVWIVDDGLIGKWHTYTCGCRATVRGRLPGYNFGSVSTPPFRPKDYRQLSCGSRVPRCRPSSQDAREQMSF